MHLTPGSRLGAYEVIAAIGRGGMGEVFRARDSKLGRDVALKVLPSHLGHDPERRRRLEREAKVLASLNHPNIAAIHGYEDIDGVQGLVLELVEGPTLADRLARGAIPLVEALNIAVQIADALEAAHNAGIVHRDLKPANVKLRSDGRVKVLDFGLAKALVPDDQSETAQSPTITNRATQSGVILGTPAYMSPEQARGIPVDKRADVWAFGCVVYEMLTGTRAFGGDHATDTIVSVMSEEPKWHVLSSNTPSAVRRLLRRCLVKDPRARLRDLGDAQIELRDALTVPAIDDAATPGMSSAHRRGRVVPWVAAVVMTGLAGGFSAWSVMRPANAPSRSAAERLMIGLPATAPIVDFTARVSAFTASGSLAISPDGRTLVYVSPTESPRLSRLFVRSLDADEPRPLDGTDGASAPFFSPDARSVGFFAAGKLKRASVTGGGISTICDVPENTGGSGGTWGPDDTIVFAGPTSDRAGLRRVPAYGGTPQVLTTPDPADGGGHGDPAFIPGTQALLFTTRLTKVGSPQSVRVLSLTTGQHHKLIDGDSLTLMDARAARGSPSPLISEPKYTPAGYLVFKMGSTIAAAPFRPDTFQVTGPVVPMVEEVNEFDISLAGRIVYVPAPSYGGQLVWVDRDGSPEPILDQDERFGRPRLSPNGSQLAVEVLRGARSDIGVYRFDSHALTLLTTDGASNSPSWHPDGRRIAFRAPGRLVWQSADGTAPPEVLLAASDPVLRSASSLAAGVFSPGDGSALLFGIHGSAGTSADVFRLDLSDRRIEPLVQRPGNQWAVRVSPDGKWISYASDESGRFEVYLEPSTRGQVKYQVSNDGGSEAVWSPTGNELFYRVGDRMMAVPITKNPDSPSGVPHVLFTGRYQRTDLPQYDVTPDGLRFVMVRPIMDELDARTIRIVDGWFDEIKRRDPVSR